jgi:alpha-amylase/alpha-mannosidase (GH57 family)
MEKYICIHSHFYQPPRENPWLEAIELQDSAYPYHDWNERITVECYAPNAASRRLDGEWQIVDIVNNYSKISFNVGPTLLSWMETNAPDTYQAILDADQESQQRFSGHGSALAQAYNHLILPLANRRDKYTQIYWGIRDFERRFQRQPEGMWLPETAVDLETLEALAEQGIKFTILAPHQAARTRRLGGRNWRDVRGARIDPTRAYLLRLPSRRTINLFFYDGPVSRAVAFERLLDRGENFAHRLLGAFAEERSWPQLVHIATDGETYGHHHHHGDMALAYALEYIESNGLARLTNYGEYLEKHPPTHEVAIIENTSWSCVHGIERWRSDCGCNSGGRPGWNQKWRRPLRDALDWLRDSLAPAYEERAGNLLKGPWVARNQYIDVALDRSRPVVEKFLSEQAQRPLNQEETITVLKLLELQRHAMLMYTSCGWFFDELSGIETVQIIQYAARTAQLAQELFGDSYESQFVELLEQALSNIRAYRDGRWIYENFARPAMVDLPRLAAHYAVSSLFEEYTEQTNIYSYTVDSVERQTFEAGRAKLAVGRVRVTHHFIPESALLDYGVLHWGDHNLNAGIEEHQNGEDYQPIVQELSEAFSRADFPEVIRAMDRRLGESSYSLRTLFKDEQRKILDQILESTLSGIEAIYRQQYETNYPLMRFLIDLGNPIPKSLHPAVDFIINTDLRAALSQDELDTERINSLLEEARACNINLDGEGLGLLFRQTIERMMSRLVSTPEDQTCLERLVGAAELARATPFEVDLWKVQNLYYRMLQEVYPQFQQKAQGGDQAALEWVNQFVALGGQLSVRTTKDE